MAEERPTNTMGMFSATPQPSKRSRLSRKSSLIVNRVQDMQLMSFSRIIEEPKLLECLVKVTSIDPKFPGIPELKYHTLLDFRWEGMMTRYYAISLIRNRIMPAGIKLEQPVKKRGLSTVMIEPPLPLHPPKNSIRSLIFNLLNVKEIRKVGERTVQITMNRRVDNVLSVNIEFRYIPEAFLLLKYGNAIIESQKNPHNIRSRLPQFSEEPYQLDEMKGRSDIDPWDQFYHDNKNNDPSDIDIGMLLNEKNILTHRKKKKRGLSGSGGISGIFRSVDEEPSFSQIRAMSGGTQKLEKEMPKKKYFQWTKIHYDYFFFNIWVDHDSSNNKLAKPIRFQHLLENLYPNQKVVKRGSFYDILLTYFLEFKNTLKNIIADINKYEKPLGPRSYSKRKIRFLFENEIVRERLKYYSNFVISECHERMNIPYFRILSKRIRSAKKDLVLKKLENNMRHKERLLWDIEDLFINLLFAVFYNYDFEKFVVHRELDFEEFEKSYFLNLKKEKLQKEEIKEEIEGEGEEEEESENKNKIKRENENSEDDDDLGAPPSLEVNDFLEVKNSDSITLNNGDLELLKTPILDDSELKLGNDVLFNDDFDLKMNNNNNDTSFDLLNDDDLLLGDLDNNINNNEKNEDDNLWDSFTPLEPKEIKEDEFSFEKNSVDRSGSSSKSIAIPKNILEEEIDDMDFQFEKIKKEEEEEEEENKIKIKKTKEKVITVEEEEEEDIVKYPSFGKFKQDDFFGIDGLDETKFDPDEYQTMMDKFHQEFGMNFIGNTPASSSGRESSPNIVFSEFGSRASVFGVQTNPMEILSFKVMLKMKQNKLRREKKELIRRKSSTIQNEIKVLDLKLEGLENRITMKSNRIKKIVSAIQKLSDSVKKEAARSRSQKMIAKDENELSDLMTEKEKIETEKKSLEEKVKEVTISIQPELDEIDQKIRELRNEIHDIDIGRPEEGGAGVTLDREDRYVEFLSNPKRRKMMRKLVELEAESLSSNREFRIVVKFVVSIRKMVNNELFDDDNNQGNERGIDKRMKMMKIIDGFIKPNFFKFGTQHTSILVKNLGIHWFSNSLVRIKELQSSDFYEDIICLDTGCPLLGTPNSMYKRFLDIANTIIYWNSRVEYSAWSAIAKDNKRNCQQFTEQILYGLKSTNYHRPVIEYLETLKQIVLKRTIERKNNNNLLSSDNNKEFLKNLKFIDISKNQKFFETYYGFYPRHKEIHQIQPTFFKKNRNYHSFFKNVKNILVFKTHKELDDLVYFYKKRDARFEANFPGVHQLLKGFDRAFSMKHLKMEGSGNDDEIRIYRPSERGCPFDTKKDEKKDEDVEEEKTNSVKLKNFRKRR